MADVAATRIKPASVRDGDGAFRDELKKRMPGFAWTVRKVSGEAVGTQSSGSNRTATLIVRRRCYNGEVVGYDATFYGYGLKSAAIASSGGTTVAQALRNLQNTLSHRGRLHSGAAGTMQAARTAEQVRP